MLTNNEAHGDSAARRRVRVPGVFVSYSNGRGVEDAASRPALTARRRWPARRSPSTSSTPTSWPASRHAARTGRSTTITPSITAPGVDILAALGDDTYDSDIHGFISGTSMSSPHVAGAGALLSQARPDWSAGPAAVERADDDGAADRPQPRRPRRPRRTPKARTASTSAPPPAAGLLFDETLGRLHGRQPGRGRRPEDPQPAVVRQHAVPRHVLLEARAATVPGTMPTRRCRATSRGRRRRRATPARPRRPARPGHRLARRRHGHHGHGRCAPPARSARRCSAASRLRRATPSFPSVTMPVAVVPLRRRAADRRRHRPPGATPARTPSPASSRWRLTEFAGSVLGLVPGIRTEGTIELDLTNTLPYDDLSQGRT